MDREFYRSKGSFGYIMATVRNYFNPRPRVYNVQYTETIPDEMPDLENPAPKDWETYPNKNLYTINHVHYPYFLYNVWLTDKIDIGNDFGEIMI